MTDLPPFPGFRTEALDFLRDLRTHNDRDWFKPRKATYDDELLWPARCLVADVAAEAERRGVPLAAQATKSVFRIYRDTRFSTNKAPYKTHVGVVWTRSGAKGDPGGFYAHIEPDGGSFLAAGFWAHDPKALRKWRERLAGDPASWRAMRAQVEDVGLTLAGRDALKRMPRGFEDHAGSDIAEALRWKGTTASRPVADTDVQTPDFAAQVVAFGRDVLPLLEWGWAVEDA